MLARKWPVTASPIQKNHPARAALPGVDPEIAQHIALPKAIAVDAHGNACAARGTSHFGRPDHGCVSLRAFSLLVQTETSTQHAVFSQEKRHSHDLSGSPQ
jgi:hypothetical protein